MKKVILALAVVSVTFAACNNSGSDNAAKADSTKTKVDSSKAVVDTTAKAVDTTKKMVDTTKKAEAPKK
jgi:hypothetical protein